MKQMSRAKAENYARHRLPYADEAVRHLLAKAGAASQTIADIGAGTGLLTRHFAGRASTVYAVEPEPAMRVILERDLTGVISVDGTAEATGLPDQSVNLIVIGNAYHRFHPAAAPTEFARILRPGGWLAIFSYGFAGIPTADLRTRFPEWAARVDARRLTHSPDLFFGTALPGQQSFTQSCTETWDEYWGAVLSEMEAPDGREPWFAQFEETHRAFFNRQAVDGLWTFPYSTRLLLGQPVYA